VRLVHYETRLVRKEGGGGEAGRGSGLPEREREGEKKKMKLSRCSPPHFDKKGGVVIEQEEKGRTG